MTTTAATLPALRPLEGPDERQQAALAARRLKAAHRRPGQVALLVVQVIVYLALLCSFLPAAVLLAPIHWLRRFGSSRLDRRAWEEAAPTAGAVRYRSIEVAPPEGLATRAYRGYRWFSVVDEAGRPALGVFGVHRTEDAKQVHILPAGAAAPLPPPRWWSSNAWIANPPWKRLSVVHWTLADERPLLAVRLADPQRRRQLEALVYAPAELDDVALAVLASMARLQQHVGVGIFGRRRADLPAAPPTPLAPSWSPTGPGSWTLAAEPAWPHRPAPGPSYRTLEVAPPPGLARSHRGFRWWSVLDEHGTPVFGLVGWRRHWDPAVRIVLAGSSATADDVATIARWWEANTVITRAENPTDNELRYLDAADVPLLTVGVDGPDRRSPHRAGVVSPALEDHATAVLSCLAVFRLRKRAPRLTRRGRRNLPAAPALGVGPMVWTAPQEVPAAR